MSRDARKQVLMVFNQVQHKPACTVTEEDSKIEEELYYRYSENQGTFTAQLTCAFVFTYAYCWFSGASAQMINHP